MLLLPTTGNPPITLLLESLVEEDLRLIKGYMRRDIRFCDARLSLIFPN